MMTKMKFSKRTFTLVELIIVIAIIAILAVTSFLLLTKWLSNARDASRTSDLSTIEKSLNLYFTEKSVFPKPENYTSIMVGTQIIGYQGVFGDGIKDAVGNISMAPMDPNDKSYYVYYTDSSLKNMQLLGFAENDTSYNPNVVNATDYSNRYFTTKGSYLGVFLKSDNTPVNMDSSVTGLDILNTTSTYKAIFENGQTMEGTGLKLQFLRSNINNGGAGFGAPKDCPDGFISVPGNKDFGQPGFCVAKYEMKQKIGTEGNISDSSRTRKNGISEICNPDNPCYNLTDNSLPVSLLDGKIESKPEGMPVVNMNQATAIQACGAMGSGYHLITNRERMTISRNVEQQADNWSNGAVGKGGIYKGKNIWADSSFTANADASNLGCQGGQNYDGSANNNSHTALGTSTACNITTNGVKRNKRALKLSNNQRIRDMAGNVWEHVNKANTINGIGFASGNTNLSNGDTDRKEWSNATQSERDTYGGPAGSSFMTDNGVGAVWYTVGKTNNIFLRGGTGGGGNVVGIFTLHLSRLATSQGGNVGFRCVR